LVKQAREVLALVFEIADCDASLAVDFRSSREPRMLEINSLGLQPINPTTRFRSPIPSGNTRNQHIVFNIPPSLSLNHSTLRIHYYNYESELPLTLPN